jgi:two-component system KDP operon response regulator KdpE
LDNKLRTLRAGAEKPTHLTRLEARLLRALMSKPDQAMQNEQLILQVWGPEGATNDMLRQLVLRLRDKLEKVTSSPALVETVSPAGYTLKTTR